MDKLIKSYLYLDIMSWLNRNQVLQSAQAGLQWPRDCQFNCVEVDDQSLADLLLQKDTLYEADDDSSQYITYLFGGDKGMPYQLISANTSEDINIWRDHAPTAKNVVGFVHFARLYGGKSTAAVRVSDRRWLNLIQTLALPPLALELLHDNNGGSASRFSPCSSKCVDSCEGPCAYHIWMKPPNFSTDGYFVYARHNFHTGQNLFLFASTKCEFLLKKVAARLERHPNSTLFHVLYSYLTFCFYAVENGRWEVDDGIYQLERRIGRSHFVSCDADVVAVDKLGLTQDMAWARNMLHEYIKPASILESLHIFTENQLHRYVKHDSSIDKHDATMPHGPITALSDAFGARASQISAQIRQMEGLSVRVETQFKIVTATVSERDSQVGIGIARSARADNQLMKRIAIVTMVFLPPTFFATFFSMVFFQPFPANGSSEADIDQYNFAATKWIWVYFVCTIPLTVLLTWSYGLGDLVRGMWQKPRLEQVE